MSKPKRWTSEQKKATVVGVVTAMLVAANLVPLHYSKQLDCQYGGTYGVSGTTLGVPLTYFETSQGSKGDCSGYVDGTTTKSFSMQLLLGDVLVFGLVVLGLNVIVDRRTRA